jgi:hypothetical protein
MLLVAPSTDFRRSLLVSNKLCSRDLPSSTVFRALDYDLPAEAKLALYHSIRIPVPSLHLRTGTFLLQCRKRLEGPGRIAQARVHSPACCEGGSGYGMSTESEGVNRSWNLASYQNHHLYEQIPRH